jgi:hypothetical protein
MAHRDATRVVPALRADHLVDLLFHQLGEHAETDTDAEREQPLLGRVPAAGEKLGRA